MQTEENKEARLVVLIIGIMIGQGESEQSISNALDRCRKRTKQETIVELESLLKKVKSSTI